MMLNNFYSMVQELCRAQQFRREGDLIFIYATLWNSNKSHIHAFNNCSLPAFEIIDLLHARVISKHLTS